MKIPAKIGPVVCPRTLGLEVLLYLLYQVPFFVFQTDRSFIRFCVPEGYKDN